MADDAFNRHLSAWFNKHDRQLYVGKTHASEELARQARDGDLRLSCPATWNKLRRRLGDV